MTKLRDYQQNDVDRLLAAYESGDHAVIYQLPTGGGKTQVGAAVANNWSFADGSVVWLSHRIELLNQSKNRLREVFGMEPGENFYADSRVIVGTIERLLHVTQPLKHVKLVVLDEIQHYSRKHDWSEAVRHYFPYAKVLGLSATPVPVSGTFRDSFDRMICGPSVRRLQVEGYLSRFAMFCPPKPRTIDKLAATYHVYCKDRKTILFAESVDRSREIAARFNKLGIKAAHLDYETPHTSQNDMRSQIIHDFAEGDTQVLCNYKILGEGVDIPNVHSVIVLRRLHSIVEDKQAWGRALRVTEGKKVAGLIAFGGLFHGTPSDPIYWSLDGYEPGQCATRIHCRHCHRLFRPKEHGHCPSCLHYAG